jgi:hypothetical protein
MRVIVAGGRNFQANKKRVMWCVDTLKSLGATAVFSGRCGYKNGRSRGGDGIGEVSAKILELPVKGFPANWKKFGLAAGPIRNGKMVKLADALVVFPGGSGTDNVTELALVHGLKVVRYSEGE